MFYEAFVFTFFTSFKDLLQSSQPSECLNLLQNKKDSEAYARRNITLKKQAK